RPFFEKLETIAGERPVLLLVLSDHGDAFGEHHNVRHGTGGPRVTLHDETIHIPMILWGPGIVESRKSVTFPFSLLDVAPTVLALAGISAPAGWVGRDFSPLIVGSAAGDREMSARWERPAISYKNTGIASPAAWAFRTATRKTIVTRRGIDKVDPRTRERLKALGYLD